MTTKPDLTDLDDFLLISFALQLVDENKGALDGGSDDGWDYFAAATHCLDELVSIHRDIGPDNATEIQAWLNTPVCWINVEPADGVIPDHGMAAGEYAERIHARMAKRTEEIEYWTKHLAEIGFLQLGKADMPEPGTTILVRRRPVTLVKANAKTVSVRNEFTGGTLKYGYEDVRLIETEEATA